MLHPDLSKLALAAVSQFLANSRFISFRRCSRCFLLISYSGAHTVDGLDIAIPPDLDMVAVVAAPTVPVDSPAMAPPLLVDVAAAVVVAVDAVAVVVVTMDLPVDEVSP